MNHDAIDTGIREVKQVRVPAEWANAKDDGIKKQLFGGRPEIRDYIDNVLALTNAQKGDTLPVSTFLKDADGTVPLGSAAYEKRGIAVDVPEWQPEFCIQCNFLCLPARGNPPGGHERAGSGERARRNEDETGDRPARLSVRHHRLHPSTAPAAAPARRSAPA